MSDLDAYRRASPRFRLGVGAGIVLVLLALAVTVGIGVWRSAAAPVERIAEASATPDITTDVPAEAYVHVSGAVRRPGLYVVEPGARVVDAVSAAGGFADDADPEAVNLARPVSDGEQLRIPAEGEEVSGRDAAAGALVNLNTADLETLETLTGIGPALAQRIVEWRESEGRFGSVDDLLAVSGIGPSVLEAVREDVTV